MPSIPGFSWSSSPTVLPGPMTRLNTPSGTPASRYTSVRIDPGEGRDRGRLEHDGIAGHEGRRRRPGRERHREVERADDREHAVRAEDRAGVDGRIAEVVHLVVVVRVVLGRLRVVADEVGHLLDLAEGFHPRLAHLVGHDARVLHEALGDELRGIPKDGQAALPAEMEPGRLRTASGGDRVLDVIADAAREGADQDVGIDRRADLEGPVAIALDAIDDVAVVAPEARSRPLEAGLELGVELLVVGAQGGVGDLGTRRGGHC